MSETYLSGRIILPDGQCGATLNVTFEFTKERVEVGARDVFFGSDHSRCIGLPVLRALSFGLVGHSGM